MNNHLDYICQRRYNDLESILESGNILMSSLFGLLELTSKKGQVVCWRWTEKEESCMARPPYRAEQRNQIFACFINAASELMEDEGMEALTLRCVAKRAGYNLSLIHI